MAGTTQSQLVEGDTTASEVAAGVTVGLSAILFALAVAAMFEWVSLTGTLAGVPTATLLGGLLIALGVAVIAFGVGSRLGYVETDPDASAGLVASFGAAVPWLVIGGGVASETLGFGVAGGVAGAVVAGSAAFVATAVPPR